MITSLFSIFDPTTFLSIQLNWIILGITLILIPLFYWKSNSRPTKITIIIVNTLNKEFDSLFISKFSVKGSRLITISLFILIIINNVSRNFPYTFCSRAHLRFSLAIAVPIWISIILFYWINLTTTILAHLVPSGTPPILIPLIVIIEITSNVIRPIALAVRLTANLIAGHLLIALLGNTFNINTNFWIIILLIQTIFIIFELIVALIQSYVFSVLITLYSREIS